MFMVMVIFNYLGFMANVSFDLKIDIVSCSYGYGYSYSYGYI